MAFINTFVPIPSLLMNIINVITTVCMLMAIGCSRIEYRFKSYFKGT